MTSGGPDERADCSIAKQLANLQYNTSTFNQVPPHFFAEYAQTIPFRNICRCYRHLPDNVRKMLPLLLAQLVHHYHSDSGQRSLGLGNPLLRTYLWNDPQGILLRHELHSNLRGGVYGNSTLKSKLRDIPCDQFLMGVQGLVNQTVIMKQQPMTPAIVNALRTTTSLLNDVTNGCYENDFPSYQSQPVPTTLIRGVAMQPCPAATAHSSALPLPQTGTAILLQHGPQEAAAVVHQNGAFGAFRLSQAPSAFRVPGSMDVSYAWFRYHTKGADKQGLWRDKTSDNIDASVTGSQRSSMREMFNKAKNVCLMLQGRNTHEEVDQIGAEEAFQRCRTKVRTVWGCDILNDGNAAVRTVYQIMIGQSFKSFDSLTIDKCKAYRQLCLDSSWVNPAALIQQTFRFPDIQTNEGGNASEESDDVLDIDMPVGNGLMEPAEPEPSMAPAEPEPSSFPLPIKECFVCEICNPLRLFTKWTQYLSHYRDHNKDARQQIFSPEKDEVRVALGRKADFKKTSQYVIQSHLYWKRYSPETQHRFLRRRILSRKILQIGDKINVKYSDTGECKCALVLDPTVVVHQKAHYVQSVQYFNHDSTPDTSLKPQQIYVTSIVQHWPLRAQPTPLLGGHAEATAKRKATAAPVLSSCTGLPKNDPICDCDFCLSMPVMPSPPHAIVTSQRVFVRDIACSGIVDRVLLNSEGLLIGYRIIYDPVDADQSESGNHPCHSVFRMIKSPENWPSDALGLNACVKVTDCFNRHKRGISGVGRICALCVDMKNYVHYYAISFENADAVSYVHETNARMVAPGTAAAPPKAAPAPAPAAAPTTPLKKLPFPAATPSASVSASALKAPAAKRPDVSSADIHSRLRSSALSGHATFKFLSSRSAPYDATAADLESVANFSSFATPATHTGCIIRQQAASLATTQPQPHPATSRSRAGLRQNLSDLFHEATPNRGEAATTLSMPERPTVVQNAVECTPLSESDAQLDIGALIMLRDVAQLGTCLRIPLMPLQKQHCITPKVGITGGVKFPIFEFRQAAFIIDDMA